MFLLSLLSSCCPVALEEIEPQIVYVPQQGHIDCLPGAFEPLAPQECRHLWGQELVVGLAFAGEMDFYRAITSFKRARIFLPRDAPHCRRLQIDYYIVVCYYLGNKWSDAIASYESSPLVDANADFPAARELLILLHDSYRHTGQCDKAEQVLQIIRKRDPPLADTLQFSGEIATGDIDATYLSARNHPRGTIVQQALNEYEREKFSVRKARTLNALLPGAGYLYVGQKQTAATSFVINALFIAATWISVERHNIPLAVILGSLECGWYFGGINGAGLAARQYNQSLYEAKAKEAMLCAPLFPVLLFQTCF